MPKEPTAPSTAETGASSGLDLSDEMKGRLHDFFQRLPNEIVIFLFTANGKNEAFNSATQELVKTFAGFSHKIRLETYPLEGAEAKRWKVDHSPTLIFAPERYAIRYVGAPLGEEGRTFMEAMGLLGLGKSQLSEQSVRILKRIKTPRLLRVFVSPMCPYCPQQAVNAIKAAIEAPDKISVEIIDIESHPALADKYDAHSVPQVFANDTLVAKGAQPEELFCLSVEKMEQQNVFIPESDAELIECDVLVVGGGPAGLSAAIYAVRAGLKTVVVEKGILGGQVATTPVVENYPGFTRVGGKTLVDFMVNHALEYAQILQGEAIMDIRPGQANGRLEVISTRRRFLVRAVLLATGAHYAKLGVPGEERLSGRGVSYCATCDGQLFRGKKVLVVGGGNSAATEALYLNNLGVDVTIVHRRDTLRAREHLAAQIQERQIPVLWNTEVKEIQGEHTVEAAVLINNKTGEKKAQKVDGVFIAVGYAPDVALAQKLGLRLRDDGFIAHDTGHRTNQAGIYCAGDVEGGYRQIVTAAGSGAEAAMAIFEDLSSPYWKQPSTHAD